MCVCVKERERASEREAEEEGGGYGCCEIIAYSLNIKAWRSASSCSADGGRGGIARRAYAYAYTRPHAAVCMYIHTRYAYTCTHEREREEEGNDTGGGSWRRFKGNAEGMRVEEGGRTGNATESRGGRRGNYGSFLTCERCA